MPRVGIATGQVVVDEVADGDGGETQAVSGQTPSLAARLQRLAQAGSIVVGERTHRLLGSTFEFADLGPQDLTAGAEPVSAWRVAGERRTQSRFEARHPGALTEFVGRDLEMDVLSRRWGEASAGEGQVVLISGEPGIGKSRLTREIRERIGDTPHTRLRYQCSQHHASSALHPLITQMTFAAGIQTDDPAPAKLDKLEALIKRATSEVAAVAWLFAELLTIPAGYRYPALDYTPQRQKELTLTALLGQLSGLAAEQPVLMIFEDVHWIDPTTQELLDLIVDHVSELPVLVLIAFRPEYVAPWMGTPHVTALILSRLNRRRCVELVAHVPGSQTLPEGVQEEIAARTEGVPLFVEELTKAIVEAGPCSVDSARPMPVPATLQDSLMARLDRLGSAKEVAQLGAVIGRPRPRPLLPAQRQY